MTRWKINLFSKPSEQDLSTDFLTIGDIIWINNMEKNVSLVSSKPFLENQEDENFLNKTADRETNFIQFLNTNITDVFFFLFFFSTIFLIYYIFVKEIADYFGNTNGMWVVEKEGFKKGGTIQWGSYIRLRHLSSGRYLCVRNLHYTNNEHLVRSGKIPL